MRSFNLEKLEFPTLKTYLIKEARTPLGRRYLEELSPFNSLPALLEEGARVREMMRLLAEKGRLPFPELAPLSPAVKRALRGGVLSVAEALTVRRYLYVSREVVSFFRSFKGLEALAPLIRNFPSLSPLRRRIDEILDEEGVRPEASPYLLDLKKAQERVENRLRKRLEELLRRYAKEGVLQEELLTRRHERYVFPIKAEARGKVPGILHDVSASGATVFIEPLEIVQLENELERLRHEEEREVERLLRELSEEVARFSEELLLLEELLATVDLLQAKAVLGERLKGHIPRYKASGAIKLKEAAHPLLLLAGRPVVRNDFLLPEEKPVVIISGPNMGGKTVALKTLGLLLVMAQCGLPIPAASESEVPLLKSIFVDLGDEQDLSLNESSFSAHVKNLKKALEEAGPGRLFLLDEIGRGTAPEEGAALAMAVLEKLYEKGARVLATTHYEALKAFSFTREWILPLAVSFDEKTGSPTYKLLYGVAGLSLGLSLAARLGLPEEVISRARQYLGQGEEAFKEVIAGLKRLSEELEAEKISLLKEKARLEEERKRLKAREEELKRRFEAREEALSRRLEEKLKELDADFGAFLEELRAQKAGEKKARLAFDEFLKEKVLEVPAPKGALPVEVGARVRLKGLGQEGRVLRLKGQVAEVQLGPFRVEVGVKDLIVLPEESPRPSYTSLRVDAEREVPEKLNVIGLTVEDALSELEKVLDRAFLAGRSRLVIVHGLGKGRLLRAIRNFLESHTQVATVRPGSPFEGGEAVTIVELANKGEGCGA